jgi:hypothetical protein
MIDVLFEQRAIQNTGLAAETIWCAVNETYELKDRIEGVPFALVFLVLPLTFHRRTAGILASRRQPGAIYKAIAEDREITVGLQSRMQAMAPRTFQALSIAFSTGLLKLDQNRERHLISGRKKTPVVHVTEDVKTILKAAKRVGQTFAELTMVQITTQLGVQF